ncbi:hypothetical protein GCM10010339_38180 [Streptomyces alanosinicus]|uniref:Uncharacterized protein n=1 Tax=Streptomyces alanosinicus TaxID=68171 RepID=A0A918YJ57_9ACTN|nr:hypothetical protein GCM10010339_38180 [Streptomyces alanosinicus]
MMSPLGKIVLTYPNYPGQTMPWWTAWPARRPVGPDNRRASPSLYICEREGAP